MEFSFAKIRRSLGQWYVDRPHHVLDLAYQAALRIQKLEEEYFEGNPVSPDHGYGSSTYMVLQSQLRNHLNSIRLRLLEYQIATIAPGNWQTNPLNSDNNSSEITNAEKLTTIDRCLARYEPETKEPIDFESTNDFEVAAELERTTARSPILHKSRRVYSDRSFFPISFLQTFQRLKTVLSPDASGVSQEIAEEIEQSRYRATAAIRFFFGLLILTISVQFFTKNLVFSPLIDAFQSPASTEISFQDPFKTEVLKEFRAVQQTLELEVLISEINGTPIDRDVQQSKLRKEASKLVTEFNLRSIEGTKNLLADITAGVILYSVIFFGRQKIRVIRDFLYETLAGLNDSAKAFLIIVITDTFVGYHSSDGWDALIKILFEHFGLPENLILTDAFIATVPVFLDASFKFWIFQYLRRASPPTSAIYREMND